MTVNQVAMPRLVRVQGARPRYRGSPQRVARSPQGPHIYRDIVQLAERLSGGQEAAGSSPAISTIRRTRKIKNVERRATEPVRWPPRARGVGGSRQMRVSCDLLNHRG